MQKSFIAILLATTFASGNGFTSPKASFGVRKASSHASNAPVLMSSFSDDFIQSSPEATRQRLQDLVTDNPVVLFMKGSKVFPQCGFSSTAVQILNTFNLDFHTVDVLADEAIRSGVKEFSDWPTIPQLYVAGEFIGGSDIMIEMYQSGELGEMIEKNKADMM